MNWQMAVSPGEGGGGNHFRKKSQKYNALTMTLLFQTFNKSAVNGMKSAFSEFQLFSNRVMLSMRQIMLYSVVRHHIHPFKYIRVFRN